MRWAALTLAVVGASCDADTVIRSPASGFFEPVEVDFGEVAAGRTSRSTTTLRNTSGGRIVVRSVRFEPERDVFGAFLVSGGTLNGASLSNGRAVGVELRFGPRAAGTFDATMVMEADDLAVTLPIRARARDERLAAPAFDPQAVVFSGVPIGTVLERTITVRNVGDQPGELARVELSDGGPFSVTAAGGEPLVLPLALGSGGETRFEVRYAPTVADIEDRTELRVFFSSGESGVVPLSGRSTNLARLVCPLRPLDFGSVPRGQSARETVRCQVPAVPWSFEGAQLRPGSAPYFRISGTEQQGEEIRVEVEFDASGPLGQHLAVLEIAGRPPGETRVTLTGTIAAPRVEDLALSLELTWNTPFSDFDLHLVRSGGTPFVVGEDCYFAAKNPSWGSPESLSDDPFLDRDDREGYGPERLTLLELGEPSYDVFVQYHDFTRGEAEATTVEVAWSSRTGASGRETRDLLECGRWWHVGTLLAGPPVRFLPVDQVSWAYRGRAAEKCR